MHESKGNTPQMAWAWGEPGGGRLEGSRPGAHSEAARPAWPRPWPWPASSDPRCPGALQNSRGMWRESAFVKDKFLTKFQFFGMENQQLPVTKCTKSACRIHKCGQSIYFESKCG